MKLARLITVNWGNLESRELSAGRHDAAGGRVGSGKTTLLDAIQTLLTASRGGVFFYNPGQDEATQGSRTKDKRTLADYCLGRENVRVLAASRLTLTWRRCSSRLRTKRRCRSPR